MEAAPRDPLSPLRTLCEKRRRRIRMESATVLVVGLALMLLPSSGARTWIQHGGFALGLLLALVGFFWHRKVLRLPPLEDMPVLQLLERERARLVRITLPATGPDEGNRWGRETVLVMAVELAGPAEQQDVELPGELLEPFLQLLPRIAPQAVVITEPAAPVAQASPVELPPAPGPRSGPAPGPGPAPEPVPPPGPPPAPQAPAEAGDPADPPSTAPRG